jgi:hypothetical protein
MGCRFIAEIGEFVNPKRSGLDGAASGTLSWEAIETRPDR